MLKIIPGGRLCPWVAFYVAEACIRRISPTYVFPMDYSDFIVAAYAVTGGLILWLILSTWVSARKVTRQLGRKGDRA